MATRMTMTVVGNAPITGLSEALGINARGQVVGQEEGQFAFVWTPTVPNGTTGSSIRLQPLPLPGGPGTALATGINAGSDVVGASDTLSPTGAQIRRAVLWRGGAGNPIDIGTLIPNPLGGFLGSSEASAINDAGVIVGTSDSVTSRHAFLRDPAIGILRDLGSLIPFTMLPGTPDESDALAINNRGDVVGRAAAIDAASNRVSRAFLVTAGALFMQDLSTLLIDPTTGQRIGNSEATAINDLGAIVGNSDVGLPGATQTTAAKFSAGGVPSGILPAEGSATGINAAGTIIGQLGIPSTGGYRLTASMDLRDLTTLVGIAGVTVRNVIAINARGQMAANIDRGAGLEAALLTP